MGPVIWWKHWKVGADEEGNIAGCVVDVPIGRVERELSLLGGKSRMYGVAQ